MKGTPDTDRLKAAPKHERHFYATNRAFGRFGMRIFEPQTMNKPHWLGHVEANFCIHHTIGYDVDNEPVVVPPGRLAVFPAGIPHRLHTVTALDAEPPKLANIYLPLDVFLTMNHIMPMQVALLGGG